jgi:hypothetical protein
LIGWARQPAIWNWLDRLANPHAGGDSVSSIDNRLDAAPQTSDVLEKAFQIPSGHRTAAADAPGALFPGLSPQEFENVRDNQPSKHDEQAVSLHLLDILRRTDPETLQQWSLGPISYAQLFQQPNQYRGRLVDIAGTVRRANWLELPPNRYNIEGYYQLWLWPQDNPGSPMIVYCLRLPDGFPTGMTLAEQVETTGFFFKRCAYQARDTLRVAPEILAGTVQWQKRPVMKPGEPAETWPIAWVVVVAAVVALSLAGVVYLRTRHVDNLVSEPPPDFGYFEVPEPKEGDADEQR